MSDNNKSAPATKADLLDLATKAEMKAEVSKLATKAGLESGINRLEDIVKTNTLDILHIKEDIRDIRDTMATRDDISRLMSHIDAFAAEALSHRNHDTLRGGKIMEHETRLSDHETRLTTLETK